MYLLGFRITAAFVTSLVCAASFAQSVPHAQPTPTFHIHGTINSTWDSWLKGQVVRRSMVTFGGEQAVKPVGGEDSPYIAVPRSWVTFNGEHANKTVVVDDKGFYSADLPIGLYKMTAEGPTIGGATLTPYVRLFRVTLPTTIVLNGSLHIKQMTCDAIGGLEERKDACGAEDSFPIPSKEGTPFELIIRYPGRQSTFTGYVYSGGSDPPVFVAYNLFSLEAKAVSYLPKTRTIVASGSVVAEDGSGTTRHADLMSFRFEDGKAIPLN
jgi:hypothetical protein